MRHNTARSEAADIQDEFVSLVNEQVEKGKISVTQLAAIMGVDRSATHRALNGQRKLTFSEVIKISQRLGIEAKTWNTIGKQKKESRFLPLYGEVAASHWRVKGGKMSESITPIRPIDTGHGNTEDQFLYFVKEGLYAGEYAVCLPIGEGYELEDGDIVVVEETRVLSPMNIELFSTSLKVVQITDDRKLLISLDDETASDEVTYPSEAHELRGLVIGMYREIGRKK